MDKRPFYTAVIVAGGSGTRMHTRTKKQFLELEDRPVIAHTIQAFQDNDNIASIVLVIPKGDADEALAMCLKYKFTKVRNIAEGGDERFRSVYNGLKVAPSETEYVLVHDGVRPLVTQEVINRCCKYVPLTNACIAAVPVTDTIKKADARGFAARTIDRAQLWSVQTPQAFSFSLLKSAYEELFKVLDDYGSNTGRITDDAVVVENMTSTRVRIVRGDYRNIKITNPEDLITARAYLEIRKGLSQ